MKFKLSACFACGAAIRIALAAALLAVGKTTVAAQTTTQLHRAAASGNEIEVQKLLLAEDVDPNAKSNDGKTPLSLAVQSGDIGGAFLLLDRGDADPNAKSNDGNTPLHYAAAIECRKLSSGEWRVEDMAMVQLLLAAGADPNAKNNDGKTTEQCR